MPEDRVLEYLRQMEIDIAEILELQAHREALKALV
jgi:hypothetical protein